MLDYTSTNIQYLPKKPDIFISFCVPGGSDESKTPVIF